MTPRERRRVLVLAAITALVALAVRLVVLSHGRDLPPDGTFDLEIARDLLRGDVHSAVLRRFHPLEGALSALVALALQRRPEETCGLVVTVLAGALVAFFAALAAARLVEEESAPGRASLAALAAGLLAATHPGLARASVAVTSYPVSHAALAAALAAMAHALARRSLRGVALAGLATGVAYLARPDGLVLLAGLVAGSVLAIGRLGKLAPLVLLVGFAVPAAPYLVALERATGEWRLTLKKDERHLVGMVDPNAPPKPRPAPDDVTALIEQAEGHEEPAETGWIDSTVYVLRRSSTEVHVLLLLLGLIGLARTRRLGLAHAPFVLALLAFVSAHVLLKRTERYFAAHHATGEAIPFAIWSGLALAPLVARRARTVALGLACGILLAKTREPREAEKGELERAVAWELRSSALPEKELVVCGRDARSVAFLADARYLELPPGDAASVASAARASGARWLVLYVRTHGDPPETLERALSAAGLRMSHPIVKTRPDPSGGVIRYTWLLYDLERR